MKNSILIFSLILVEIVLVTGRSQTISCAIGQNFVSLADRLVERALLAKPVEENVFFYLYTVENTEGTQIEISQESLRSSYFNVNRPTKVITHGYWNKVDSDACTQPRDAFLSTGNYNVLVIDWWKMESFLGVPVLYGAACKVVPKVAEYVFQMLEFLENEGMNLKNTTLIGHSLGAHLMGMAASKLKNKVNYIVGLDPAGPKFEDAEPSERLSPDDAETVHVIHTNEGDCGMSQTLGHYDFYPNGGNKQPGCKRNPCAHSRAIELYAESISSDIGFYARQCQDLQSALEGNCAGEIVEMNDDVRTQNAQEGIYYLKTADDSPYALGE